MKSRLWSLGALVAVCVGAVVFVPVASAATCAESITGAGSSLQNDAQTNVWNGTGAGSFQTHPLYLSDSCTVKVAVTYFPTSSGQGKDQWGRTGASIKEQSGVSPFPDYIGTDAAPDPGELKNMDTAGSQGQNDGEGVVTVPVAQSAIAIVITIPDSCLEGGSPSDVLPAVSNDNLELEWFSNTIPAEKLVAKGSIKATSCPEIPSLYARSTSSGTTAGFKRYLGNLSSPQKASWAPFVENAKKAENTEWPHTPTFEIILNKVTVKFEKGSQLAEAVYNHPNTVKGSIGYADLTDAIKAGFSGTVVLHEVLGVKMDSFFFRVNNAAFGPATNNAVSPQAANGESNCSLAKYAGAPANVLGNGDWSKAIQSNLESGEAEAYPVCTLTFDLAWQEYRNVKLGSIKYTEGEANAVIAYLKYVVNGGQNATLAAHHYGTLPSGILTSARKGVTLANILF